jgi:hypothetical protein
MNKCSSCRRCHRKQDRHSSCCCQHQHRWWGLPTWGVPTSSTTTRTHVTFSYENCNHMHVLQKPTRPPPTSYLVHNNDVGFHRAANSTIVLGDSAGAYGCLCFYNMSWLGTSDLILRLTLLILFIVSILTWNYSYQIPIAFVIA